MKTFYLSLCFLFCILSSSAQNVSSVTENDNAWKGKAVEELHKQAYKFIPVVDGAFKSVNSSNNLQILVSPKGYLLNHSQIKENKTDWKVNFSIIAIGNKKVKKDKDFSIEQISPNNLVSIRAIFLLHRIRRIRRRLPCSTNSGPICSTTS